jgi:glycosyltransferase involved in cell wall biosynthesis
VRVCYFGTYEQRYPRNKVVIDAMRMAGVEVLECHHPLWELIRHKTGKFLSPRSLLAFALRFLKGYVKLIVTYLKRAGDAQVVMVGYIGQLDLVLAKLLTIVGKRRKLIFNPLVSLYDTLIDDRSLFSPDSFAAHFLFFLDRLAFRLADRIVLDTDVHIDYISEKFGIDRDKFERVFVGADEEVFSPRRRQERITSLVVLFVGKFIPLHGIPHIITAASMLEEEDIRFEIVGSGQLYDEIIELCRRLDVKNITFTDWIPYQRLAEKMAQAHICLGIFGESGKARRVIPNKVFQGLAVGMPVITGDSMASRELLTHGRSALLVPMANPEALAQAILSLKENRAMRENIALSGHTIFRRRCSTEVLGRQLKALCQGVLRRS